MQKHESSISQFKVSADRKKRIGSKYWRLRFVSGLSLLTALVMHTPVLAQSNTNSHPGHRFDRILVKPKRGLPPQALENLHAQLGSHVLRRFPRIENWQVVRLPANAAVAQMVARYKRSDLVIDAEPDYTVPALLQPDDFRYWDGSLWGLTNVGLYGGTPGADIHAPPAWDLQNEATNVIVAVVDTGVRATHEDLAANLWTNPGETGLDANGLDKATNGIDDDNDGFIDDVHGINAILGTGDPDDDYGHGTHVAGTIGAVGNNSVGIVGVCWKAQLMACKFINPQGEGAISDAITCVDYARNHGAKIINASWGDYSFTSVALRDTVNSLRDSDVILVAATGNNANNNDTNPLFPASYEYDNIIAVSATDRNDNLAWFSNFGGQTVRLGAPGQAIFSCWNGSDSDYRYMDGTSCAAPHVAGACALVWAHYPTEAHQQIMKRVLLSVDPLPGLAGSSVTGGRLNLLEALRGAGPKPPPPETTVWSDDALPAGAIPSADNGDSWAWVTNNPAPFSGTAAHQSADMPGFHEHYFSMATDTMEVAAGDVLFAYVYLDPVHPPSEVMLSWNDGCWEHRAFWGPAFIPYGTYGTSSQVDMGDLPPIGQWVRLEVPAHSLGLEGATLKGMGFVLYDGAATWDYAGRAQPAPPAP